MISGVLQEIAGESTTAQVHPRRLTEAFLEAAQRRGAAVRIGQVDGLEIKDETVRGKPFPSVVELLRDICPSLSADHNISGASQRYMSLSQC